VLAAFSLPMIWLQRCLLTVVLLAGVSAHAGTLAFFRTPIGEIHVELFDADKPITVGNFIRYVESEAYRDMIVHRWEPGFVIQGGGFRVENRASNSAIINALPTFGTILNEYSAGQVVSNLYGTIAMARAGGQTNSATSQWFFNLGDNSFLDRVDGGFTVFGRTLGGTNVLNRFQNTAVTNGIYRANLGGPLNTLPVLSATPTYDDLVYVSISLLRLSVNKGPDGHPSLSWNSAQGRPNHLEYSTSLGATGWQVLTTVTGSGELMQFSDTQAGGESRLYRVRVDY
jgi:cyclophilin family peptidyl-prolyl cis-trans isomerase